MRETKAMGRVRRAVALCVAVALVFALPMPAAATQEVVIKTMAAANSIPGGIRGIDVSQYQGKIHWEKVAADNVSFAIIRSSAGMTEDETFYTNVQGAQANNLPVGAYHYARFTDQETMKREAAFFLDRLEGLKLTYPVVLDIEDNSSNREVSRQELTTLCIQFMELAKARGHKVMLYSGTNFLKERLDLSRLSGYDLWVANYIEEPAQGQVMWQHTSYGTVDGINGRALIDIAYRDLSVRKSISVDREISHSIIGAINQRYGASIPLDGGELAQIKAAANAGLQQELNRQLDAGIEVTGGMDAPTLFALDEINFAYGETKGNITYLIQAMLFFRGHYTGEPNGSYDSQMAEALSSYQAAHQMTITGQPDRDTLWRLFQ